MKDYLSEISFRAKQLAGTVNEEKVLESIRNGRQKAPEALSDDDLVSVNGGAFTNDYHIKMRTSAGGLIEYAGVGTCNACNKKKLGIFYQLEGFVACKDCLNGGATF